MRLRLGSRLDDHAHAPAVPSKFTSSYSRPRVASAARQGRSMLSLGMFSFLAKDGRAPGADLNPGRRRDRAQW